MPDYTVSQFDTKQFTEAQNQAYAVLSAICGPAVAVAFARFYGKSLDPDTAVNIARQYGLWTQQTGMRGPAAQKALLDKLGIPVEYSPEVNFAAIQEKLLQGYTGAVSTPKHYFFLQGYDPKTGQYDTGASGSALPGGSRYLTESQIRNLGGGAQGQYISTSGGSGSESQGQTYQLPAWAANNPNAQLAANEAIKRGIDPNIFLKQLNQESGLQATRANGQPIVSGAGARGIAQLMPTHWQGKFNPDDPSKAIPYAADLMAGYLKQFNGDYR